MTPVLDVAKVVIRTKIPLPPAATNVNRGSAFAELFTRMKVGDSVVLQKIHAKSFVSWAKKKGHKLASRDLKDGNFGVWKL